MDALDQATGDDAARLFLTGMIKHHKGRHHHGTTRSHQRIAPRGDHPGPKDHHRPAGRDHHHEPAAHPAVSGRPWGRFHPSRPHPARRKRTDRCHGTGTAHWLATFLPPFADLCSGQTWTALVPPAQGATDVGSDNRVPATLTSVGNLRTAGIPRRDGSPSAPRSASRRSSMVTVRPVGRRTRSILDPVDRAGGPRSSTSPIRSRPPNREAGSGLPTDMSRPSGTSDRRGVTCTAQTGPAAAHRRVEAGRRGEASQREGRG